RATIEPAPAPPALTSATDPSKSTVRDSNAADTPRSGSGSRSDLPLQLSQRATFPFVRRVRRGRRRAEYPVQAPCFDLFRRRRRRQILIEQPRVRFRHVLRRERDHAHTLLPPERSSNQNLVAGAHPAVWLRRLSVHVDLAAAARLLRLRTGAEETRDVE